jgi:uncharacterized coiled-coil protein SlyX
MEDKVEELNQSVKDQEKILRKYEWNMRDFCDTLKGPNIQIMGI